MLSVLKIMTGYPKNRNTEIISGEVKNTYNLIIALSEKIEITVTSVPTVWNARNKNRLNTQQRIYDPYEVYFSSSGFSRGVIFYLTRAFAFFFIILKIIKEKNIDIIHVHSPVFLLPAKISCFLLKKKIKIIITAHGTYGPELKADLSPGKFFFNFFRNANGSVQLAIDRLSYKLASYVICTSNFQLKEMKSVYKVNLDKLLVCYNGVDNNVFHPKERESNLLNSKFRILFVGRFVRKKGLHILVEVAHELLKSDSQYEFVIVGGEVDQSNYYNSIISQIRNYGINNYFNWNKNVPEIELPSFFQSCDILVAPSLVYESLPTVVIEGVMSGIPVLATGKWGTPEILENKFSLLNENDPSEIVKKIKELKMSPKLRNKLIVQQNKIAKKFTLSEIRDFHINLYKTIKD